jgi:hypothetical protein
MSGSSGSPHLVKGGLIVMDPDTAALQTVIALQYDPDSLSRTLAIPAVPGGRGGAHVEALQLRGPTVETIKLEAELDATDQREFLEQFPNAAQNGLQTQLAHLELLVDPSVETLHADQAMANASVLEIPPREQPLTLFVWSERRVVPVRLTEFSIREEAFDPNLYPIRAKVSLELRVLNADDLGISNPGGRKFFNYLSNKEQLAKLATSVSISGVGVGDLR